MGVLCFSISMDDTDIFLKGFNEIGNLITPIMNKDKASFPTLTERQLDCLYGLVTGMTAKQIAEMLSLSSRTVEGYLEILKNKLNCKDRAELVSAALQMPAIKDRL